MLLQDLMQVHDCQRVIALRSVSEEGGAGGATVSGRRRRAVQEQHAAVPPTRARRDQGAGGQPDRGQEEVRSSEVFRVSKVLPNGKKSQRPLRCCEDKQR